MTVQELINKLQSLNPNDEIIVEENHGEYYHIDPERIEKEMMVDCDGHLHHAFEEDMVAKSMVVIRL